MTKKNHQTGWWFNYIGKQSSIIISTSKSIIVDYEQSDLIKMLGIIHYLDLRIKG